MAKKKHKNQQGQQFLSPEQYLKQRARTLEIGKCYITDHIKEVGEANIIVSRRHTGGRVSIAVYLVDIYCLGVKDSLYHLRMEDYELDELVERMDGKECTYTEAHNWIYGAIAFAEEAGITPHKSFNLTRYMLEEDTDDVPLLEYDFGHEGKHFLVVDSKLEASRYLPLLQKNLGEGNFDFMIRDDNDYDEDEDYDEEKWTKHIKDWSESPLFKDYGPKVKYAYRHPTYPTTMTLHYPWLQEELAKTENAFFLKRPLIDRILSLPHEELREDLEQLIWYHIGQTCDGIPEGYDDGQYNGTLSHALMLIAEVGNETTSLDAVLEVMRQTHDFFEYHICDGGDTVLIPTLYKLGKNQLGRLFSYAQEEGLNSYVKCHVFTAVLHVSMVQPERHSEVVEWFRKMLCFATENVALTKSFDCRLAGFLICDVVELQATNLEPEVKALFDTNLVDLGICGNYDEVIKDLKDPYFANLSRCELDIYERYEHLKDMFDDKD